MKKMKNRITGIFSFIDYFIKSSLKWLTITLFILLTIILSANIFVRFVPLISLHWFDEIVELLYAYLVFYGAAIVWIEKGHFCVGDWFSRLAVSCRQRIIYRLFIASISIAFITIFFIYALEITMKSHEFTPVIGMPKAVLYSCMPISAGIMVIYSAADIVREILKFAENRED